MFLYLSHLENLSSLLHQLKNLPTYCDLFFAQDEMNSVLIAKLTKKSFLSLMIKILSLVLSSNDCSIVFQIFSIQPVFKFLYFHKISIVFKHKKN